MSGSSYEGRTVVPDEVVDLFHHWRDVRVLVPTHGQGYLVELTSGLVNVPVSLLAFLTLQRIQ